MQEAGRHSQDISSDSLINRSDYLAIKDTWMEDFIHGIEYVRGFYLTVRLHCCTTKCRQIVTASSKRVSSSSRKDGGLDVCRNISSFTD
ncbi:hypothetical protein TNCV_2240181 [Trichonephila clavipes]|nr:hypothetical protein TNCV_2240181 [Trichonephila clavipes]